MKKRMYVLIFLLRGTKKAYKRYYRTKDELNFALKNIVNNPDVKEYTTHELFWSDELKKFVTIPE